MIFLPRHKNLLAEFLGTAGLLIVVVGSGIMGDNLSPNNTALALLANSIATGAGLYTLIQVFGPISGAHFNPAVSLSQWLDKTLSTKDFFYYAGAQMAGAFTGVLLTHAMFDLPLIQLSQHHRGDWNLFLSEVIATFGLIFVIFLTSKKNASVTPLAVALCITAGYWCTSSTSFANPAVSLARAFTDTFTGIQWTGVPGFMLAQVIGAFLAFKVSQVMLTSQLKT